MMKQFVMLQLMATARLGHLITVRTPNPRACRRWNQRGSVTMEHVLWAVAVIAIAGVVIAAVMGYVNNESAKIK